MVGDSTIQRENNIVYLYYYFIIISISFISKFNDLNKLVEKKIIKKEFVFFSKRRTKKKREIKHMIDISMAIVSTRF